MIKIKNYKKDRIFSLLILLIVILLSILNFYFDLDPSGSGGTKADFVNTWPYVEMLSKNFYLFGSGYTDNTPLGYMLLSWIYLIFNDQYYVRVVYFIFSYLTIVIFYKAIKEKYSIQNRNNLILFSSIIILMPAFLSGAIWSNNSILANIFFILFIICFNRWFKDEKQNKFNKLVFLQIFYLALAVYTRQYYAIFFIFLLFQLYWRLNYKNFFLALLIIFLFSLPGFYIILNDIAPLRTVFSYKIYNTFLISPSIISFYLIPFFFITYLFNKKDVSVLMPGKNNFSLIIFIIFFVFTLALIFDYNLHIGGGFFFKLSQLLFKNNIFGYITSIIGLYLLYLIFRISTSNKILIILLLILFPSYYIFQKYFEPMFLIIFILLLDLKFLKTYLKNKLMIFYTLGYFVLYLFVAIFNDAMQITKSMTIF